MNGFCLKQYHGLKGLDGQYTHTPNFSAVISSLPSPPPIPAFRPSPGPRKARSPSLRRLRSFPTPTLSLPRLLAPFFARSLTLAPRSLLRNSTETLATQAFSSSEPLGLLCSRPRDQKKKTWMNYACQVKPRP